MKTVLAILVLGSAAALAPAMANDPIRVQGEKADAMVAELTAGGMEPRTEAGGRNAIEAKQFTCVKTFNASCAVDDAVQGKPIQLRVGEADRFIGFLKDAGIPATSTAAVFPIWHYTLLCTYVDGTAGSATCDFTVAPN